MKCQFKKSVKNYKLSEDNNLLYEAKTKIFNKLDNTYKIKKELYEVPTVEILNNNLFKIYIKNFHCNEKDMTDFFKDKKIWFYGLVEII